MNAKKAQRDALIYIAHMKDDLMIAEVSGKKVNPCTCQVCTDWESDWEVLYASNRSGDLISVGYVAELHRAICAIDSRIILDLRFAIRENDHEVVFVSDGSSMIGRKRIAR